MVKEFIRIRPVTLDWDDQMPVYRQVATYLLSEIAFHDAPPGSFLPSEEALSALCATTRPTVRNALQTLRQMGFLESRKGRGTFYTGYRPTEVRALAIEPGTLGELLPQPLHLAEDAPARALPGWAAARLGASAPARQMTLRSEPPSARTFVEVCLKDEHPDARPADRWADLTRLPLDRCEVYALAATRHIANELGVQPFDPVLMQLVVLQDRTAALRIYRYGRHTRFLVTA